MRSRAARRDRRHPRRRGPALRRGALALAAAAGVGLGAAASGPLAAPLAPPRLAVERAAVVGAAHVPAADLLRRAGVARGTPLARVDRRAVAARLAAHPWVRSARAATLPPDRLLLEVDERAPAAVAPLGEAGALWWVDAGGMPFARVARAEAARGMPRLTGAADASPGRADPRLGAGLRALREARALGLAVRGVRVAAEGPHEAPALRLAPDGTRALLGPGRLHAKLARLARVLEAELEAVREAATIDLRFRRRVLLREGRPSGRGPTAGTRGGADPPEPGRAG